MVPCTGSTYGYVSWRQNYSFVVMVEGATYPFVDVGRIVLWYYCSGCPYRLAVVS